MTSEPKEQIQQLSVMAENCPAHLVNLWHCINNTFAAVSGGGGQWSGLVCCQLSMSTQCYNTCRRAKSASDLSKNCPSTDIAFYRCVERQRWGTQCCNKAAGDSSQCKAVCKAIFIQDSDPTPSQSHAVQEFCSDQVVNCITRKGINLHAQRSTQPEALQCCNEAASPECQQSCHRALTENPTYTDDQKVELMIPQCGTPLPQIKMWQCFLNHADNNNRNRRQQYHVDGAKLLCCQKARNSKCKDLCIKTHGQDWNRNYLTFNGKCSSNPLEGDMNKCLHEVEETCTMGCSGLDYCTNFNHRPTELFRSCNKLADDGAKKEVELWIKNGRISLPTFEGFSIPIKDIRRCRPDTWKTIACALQIKPCHLQGMRICKEDCLSVLRDCIDSEALPGNVMDTAENVCNVLAPPADDISCLSLTEYIVPSPHRHTAHEVRIPCQSKPCKDNEVCIVNRRKCRHPHAQTCLPYVCKPGCPVGDASTFYVPHQSYVRIPIATKDQLHCHRVCRCGHHHSLHGCVESDCVADQQCFASSGGIYMHGSLFQKGCNDCICHAGETVCTSRKCVNQRPSQQEVSRYTGLPCNCAPAYQPVCGINGRTYPSSCIARCLGLKERHYDAGTCSSQDACTDDPCGPGEVCVTRQRTCLSARSYACLQYECVPMANGCDHHHHDPVCDTQQEEFGNVCLMMSRGRKLAHRGHCLQHCKHTGTVCGMNGETYLSECAAWAARVPVDYLGSCQAVGYYAGIDSTETSCGGHIECPPLSTDGSTCKPITPPGACCPLCAGEIRIIYSQGVSDRVAGNAGIPPISVENVTEAFARHIAVRECEVFGYQSIEGDLLILVLPIVQQPTPLQIHACMVETEKLHTMFSTRNPTLTAYAATAPLLTSKLRTSQLIMPSSAATSHIIHSAPSWLLLLSLLTFLTAVNQCPHR